MKQPQKIHYHPSLGKRARTLRKQSTYSEVLLWNKLKAQQLQGIQFLRQKPIGNFIVDFYSRDLKLALEIDGKSHIGKEDEDRTKTAALMKQGIIVHRINETMIMKDMDNVLKQLEKLANQRKVSIQEKRDEKK